MLSRSDRQTMFDLPSLEPLFRPRSIAVIGASATPDKIGGVPVHYLKSFGYPGAIYPVNPNHAQVQGLKACAGIGAVPGPVDLAVVAVPANMVPAALEQAAAAGVRSVVLFSAGFAEIGEAGAAEQRKITALARRAGMRILGPNCLGLMDIANGGYATFSPVIGMGQAKAGGIGLVSQSGAFGAFAYTLARERGLGLSHWITTGNEADVELADCLAWLAKDPATKVILAYMEGCRDGEKLQAALQIAREAGKPVVITKVGRTELGAAAAASHTAALAGRDAIYEALFRQYGVYRARSIEEFFDVGYAVSVGTIPRSDRIGLVTVSGGVGVLMADEAMERGLDAAPLPAAAQDRIKAMVSFAATRNPVDVTGQVANDRTLLDRTIDIMLHDGPYDSMIVFLAASGLTEPGAEAMLKTARAMRAARPDLLVAFCSVFRPALREALEQVGCLTFEEPTRAVRALAALAYFGRSGGHAPAIQPASTAPALRPGTLNEYETLQILRSAGIPVVASRLVTAVDAAEAAAREFGYPVVVKVVSRDILHKSDVGGVRLNLHDGPAVREAFTAVTGSARRSLPDARIDGALIAPMVRDGIECILGVQRDPVFGPVVMFGLGGIFVEVLKDVSFRVAPFDEAEAHRMIREIRSAGILDGVRGKPAADIDALARALATLSQFAAAAGEPLQKRDIKPLLVLPRGKGALALDAVLVAR